MRHFRCVRRGPFLFACGDRGLDSAHPTPHFFTIRALYLLCSLFPKIEPLLKFSMQSSASLSMDGLVSAHYASGVPGQRLVLDGDITLAQRSPIPRSTSGTTYKPYTNSPLTLLSSALSALAASPEGIVAEAAARNFTLSYQPASTPIWVPDPSIPKSVSTDLTNLRTSQRAFQLAFTARVPVSTVVVAPSIPEELKYGWIQYVALLAVTGTLAWYLRRIVFGFGIVETIIQADAPRSLVKLHAS